MLSPSRSLQRQTVIARSLSAFARYGSALAVLWLVNVAANLFVQRLDLPIPGNAVAIFAMLAILAGVPAACTFFDATALFLVRHLSFFFVPLAVGIVASSGALVRVAAPLTITLVASVAVGIAATGMTAQRSLRDPA